MTTNHLSSIRSCYEFVGRARLKIDMATFSRLPLHELPSPCRAFLYAVLQLNRGKTAHAMSFLRKAKEKTRRAEELAYVLFMEGLVLLTTGEPGQAIALYKTCAEACKGSGDKGLRFDALVLLSAIYVALGEPETARPFELEAALIMPRGFLPTRKSKKGEQTPL
jgi:tetratricopeptide (TPR) repeat protein